MVVRDLDPSYPTCASDKRLVYKVTDMMGDNNIHRHWSSIGMLDMHSHTMPPASPRASAFSSMVSVDLAVSHVLPFVKCKVRRFMEQLQKLIMLPSVKPGSHHLSTLTRSGSNR